MESNQYDETKKRKFHGKCLLRYTYYAYTNSLIIRASPFCSEEGIGGMVYLWMRFDYKFKYSETKGKIS